MAESIIIHCREGDRHELLRRIEARFERISEAMWRFPANEYFVSVTPYNEYEAEYEPSDKELVEAKLGSPSIASFDFEIRRSESDQACDLLEGFVRQDCLGIDIVVDDMFRILSAIDLPEVGDFLDVYRNRK